MSADRSEDYHSENDEEFVDNQEVSQEYELPAEKGEAPDEDLGQEDPGEGGEQDQENDLVELEDDSVQGFFLHEDSVYSVSVAPGASGLVCSGGGDDRAYIWSLNHGDDNTTYPPALLEGHTDSIIQTAFSYDGKYVATASLDATVKIWDVESTALVDTLEGPGGGLEWIDWHPRGHVVLGGAEDGSCFLWKVAPAEMMGIFAHPQAVSCGKFSPNGKAIVTGCADLSLRIWNPRDQSACIGRVSGHNFHTEPIISLAIKDDSSLAITGGEDGLVCISNLNSYKAVGALRGHDKPVETVTFGLPHSAYAASGSLDGSVRVWDLNTMQQRLVCMGHKDGVIKLRHHPSAPLLISASADHSVRVWDERTGECVQLMRGHQDLVADIFFNADSTKVVSASDDKTSLVFKLNI
eukprot:TRINITY_DN4742_c0_g1_i2.p1 TRINITY_DN4742_c0_g1~~TRINITY_DN4742_c0_g1_i2.p1  ORF type:complete len:409 (-),score=107.87 TRINITY_DN4742_c0_g1_i2:95-1321(-)